MATDFETRLSYKQVVTSEALSEDVLEINSFQGANLGTTKVPFWVRVDEDFATATTMNFQVVGGDEPDLSDAFVIEQSGDMDVADIPEGYVWKGTLNHHKHCKYLGFKYTPDADATAGAVTAAFSLYNTNPAGHHKSAGTVTIN